MSLLCDWRFAHLEFLRRSCDFAGMDMLVMVLVIVLGFIAFGAVIRLLGGILAARLQRARREKVWVRDHAH